MLGVLQVAGHQHGLPAFFLDEFLDLGGFFSLVEKRDQDVCAFACERDRDRAAYAAVTAGDDGLHPLQLTRALVAGLAMVRPRIHLAGKARPRLRLFLEGRLGIFIDRVTQLLLAHHFVSENPPGR